MSLSKAGDTRQIPESFDLSGRVAVVTGGAGLLGEQFCRTLCTAGAHVVIADIAAAPAENLANALGEKALAIPTDISSPESVHRMVAQALAAFGRLDILVNNAAMDAKFDQEAWQTQPTGAFEDFPLEVWQKALEVNLTGAFLCCQAAVKPMLQQGKGVIVNLASIYAISGPDQRMYDLPGRTKHYKPVYYSVTKAGILGLTRYLATYYAGKNIRVNALSPGGVFNDHDPAFVEAYAARTVLGRMAAKDELNGALLFLVSDASSYMTGANLIVDGGWTTW